MFAVKEIFRTLQGEGVYAGTPAVFVRFSGCNAWNGLESGREDGAGFCARFCDTSFFGVDGDNGGKYGLDELVRRILLVWGGGARGIKLPLRNTGAIVVFTGGEPGLQVTSLLVDAVRDHGFRAHIETNGTKTLPSNLDWVTLSPKPPMPWLEHNSYDEVKVLWGAPGDVSHVHGHQDLRTIQVGFKVGRCWLQPIDYGDSPRTKAAIDATIDAVIQNPLWRMSVQTHKYLGLR